MHFPYFYLPLYVRSEYNFARDGYIEPTVLLCPYCPSIETKNSFLCYEICNAKNCVFKALHLFFNKYVADIKLPVTDIQSLSIPQSSEQSSGIDDLHRIMLSTTVAAADTCLELSISVQAVGTTNPLSFHHSKNHAAPSLFRANLGKMAIRAVLWPLGLCVLYYGSPCLPHE